MWEVFYCISQNTSCVVYSFTQSTEIIKNNLYYFNKLAKANIWKHICIYTYIYSSPFKKLSLGSQNITLSNHFPFPVAKSVSKKQEKIRTTLCRQGEPMAKGEVCQPYSSVHLLSPHLCSNRNNYKGSFSIKHFRNSSYSYKKIMPYKPYF